MSDTSFLNSVNKLYRVRNWQQLLGPQKGMARGGFLGRSAKITLSPSPGMSTLVRKRLFNLPQGVASYSVWLLLVQIAAQTSIPGCFLNEEMPLTAEDLSLLTDVPLGEMRVALDNLSRPEIRLIESVALETVLKEAAASDPNVQPISTPAPTASVSLQNKTESIPQGLQSPSSPDAIVPAVEAMTNVHPTGLSAKGTNSLEVAASNDIAKDIEEADQQLARLMGVFDQVQQMKQQVNTLSGPLQNHVHTRKNRKRR